MLNNDDFSKITNSPIEAGTVILLHAEAGTGKTTLLLNWLHNNSIGVGF